MILLSPSSRRISTIIVARIIGLNVDSTTYEKQSLSFNWTINVWRMYGTTVGQVLSKSNLTPTKTTTTEV
jgi:hypothetical protein